VSEDLGSAPAGTSGSKPHGARVGTSAARKQRVARVTAAIAEKFRGDSTSWVWDQMAIGVHLAAALILEQGRARGHLS
jgi:uncharacterized protein with von Willebrand factor type A (vWA) domain